MADKEVWYRFEDYAESVGYLDVTGEYIRTGSTIKVRLIEIPVISHTQKGVWLGWGASDRRFVADHWNKRYACATIRDAYVSFLARKQRQQSIHQAWVNRAERAMQAGRALMLKEHMYDL